MQEKTLKSKLKKEIRDLKKGIGSTDDGQVNNQELKDLQEELQNEKEKCSA